MREIKRAILVSGQLHWVLKNNAISNSVFEYKIMEGYEIIPNLIFEFETEARRSISTKYWEHVAYPVLPFQRIK